MSAAENAPLTPGPWYAHDRGIGWEVSAGSGTINNHLRETFSEADAVFIAAARNFRHAIENGEEPDPDDARALFPWMTKYTDATLARWMESTTLWPAAFERLAHEQTTEDSHHANPSPNRGVDNVGTDGLTDTEREACAQRYRDATSLTPEQIQKAKQVLSDQRQATVDEPEDVAAAQMIGRLKGRTGYPEGPDALWVAQKYDPSVDPEEIVQLTQILDGKPLHRLHFGIGPGWWRLILDCHKELMQICPDYQINRIKQKFGGLVYDATISSQCNDQHQATQDIIDRYEHRSRLICEETGYPGVLMEQTGSVATLNPRTAAPEWRVSTHSPLTTLEAIKECPGAIDRLLNDLFHDTAQKVEARTAEHFSRLRGNRDDNND